MNVMSIWRSGAPAHPYRKSQPVGVAHIPPFSRRSPTSRRRRRDDRWDAGTDERSHCWNHVAQRGSTMEPDICGARAVFASESAASYKLDIGLLKRLSAQERLTGRFLRENMFDFVPTAKTIISAQEIAFEKVDMALQVRLHVT